ncbi:MAG: sigma-54-dependent Fis family transcriptional regulator [Nitrospirae bacterium]|nr:sigma-54-dependent Fis family transcriptional regulator [Nitrospirota bacterium]
MAKILVVDDEEKIRKSMRELLEDEGYSVRTASCGEEALKMVAEKSQAPDLMLLDIAMPGMDGMEVLRRVREDVPGLVTLMVSAYGTIETAVKATKLGAYHFIEKPFDADHVLDLIQSALETQRQERKRLSPAPKKAATVEITGSSGTIRELRDLVARVAPSNSSVLITGENGTGKELVARSLHSLGRRAGQPFVQVNCAAIPDELIESELFGYEKGAFTGAQQMKLGRFDLAHRGTIFLDEIGDMSLKTQSKVLRILQEKTFERVGGTAQVEVDVRVIAATNKDLEQEIAQKRFREDLYYRLNVIPIVVPALRDRTEDIPLLAHAFLAEFSSEDGRPTAADQPGKSISPQALKVLVKYPWPGNVRELKNAIERLVVLSKGLVISEEDVPERFKRFDVARHRELLQDIRDLTLREARRDFERKYILEKLEEFQFNVARTAQAIGIDRAHLWRKIKQYGIDVHEPKGGAA